MTNPPRAKGTTGENQIIALLAAHGIPANRTSSSTQSHDIRLQPAPDWIIEVKNRKTWAIPKWVRSCRTAAAAKTPPGRPKSPWALFAIPGDRRTRDGQSTGVIAVLDADFAAELIAHWLREN